MEPIHQEHFEAWLFNQPDEREWEYSDPFNCVVASFLKEVYHYEHVSVGSRGSPIFINRYHITLDYPSWLLLFFDNRNCGITWQTLYNPSAKEAKAGYTKCFNTTNQNAPLHTSIHETTRA